MDSLIQLPFYKIEIHLFRKHKICLVKSTLGTSEDRGACGIKDLHAHACEAGHAVHAVNVESSGAARDVESVDLERGIDGGDNLKCSVLAITRRINKLFRTYGIAGGGSNAVGGESDLDVLTSEVHRAWALDVDLELGIVTVEEVSHRVLGDFNSSDNDLVGSGGTGSGGGGGLFDEPLVDNPKVLEVDERAGVGVLNSRDGPHHGDVSGVIGDRVIGWVSIETHGVTGVLRVEEAPIRVLRGSKGGGDESEETEPEQELYWLMVNLFKKYIVTVLTAWPDSFLFVL